MEKNYNKPSNLQEIIKDWTEPQLSDSAKIILEKRYLMRNDEDEITETPKEMFYRVAHVISSVDDDYKDFDKKETEKKFYDLMANGFFLPNSPTLRGAGLNINLSACYVLPIEDSREGIFNGLKEAVDIQSHGGGTGFDFSPLRAKNSLIKSTRGKSSGPIPFIGVFDKAIGDVIAQGGTRQGANMGILRYNHPDIEEFISCKSEDGTIKNFNLSVGTTEDFMKMVKNNEEYPLIDHRGKEIKKVNARDIFNKITERAWATGDPGMIFLDRLNEDNPTPQIGKIEATNPCGEQPLLPYESCTLGSINLRKIVTEDKKVDFDLLKEIVFNSVHYLDNVLDVNNYPLRKTEKEQKALKEILKNNFPKNTENLEGVIDLIMEEYSRSPIDRIVKGNRKIGLGVMGWADMLFALEIQYNSDKASELAEEVMGFINKTAKEASCKLAESRGVFPNWENSIYDSKSKYFKDKELKLRNATVTTIAPTGTISQIAEIEGGIEPVFALVYKRKALFDENGKAKQEFYVLNKEFEKVAKKEGFLTDEFLKRLNENGGKLRGLEKPENLNEKRWEELKSIFVTSHEISSFRHIGIQASFQKYVDNAVSKTINFPESASVEDVRGAYFTALEKGVKGITIYRDGSKAGQVLTVGSGAKDLETKIEYIKTADRPDVLNGKTFRKRTGCGNIFVTINYEEKKGKKEIFEVFATTGKAGGCGSCQNEAMGRLTSFLARSGADPAAIATQLIGIKCDKPYGFNNKTIFSCPDAVGKTIAEFLGYGANGEKIEDSENFESKLKEKTDEVGEKIKKASSRGTAGNTCPECGSSMEMSEGCSGGKCTNPLCGYSKCG